MSAEIIDARARLGPGAVLARRRRVAAMVGTRDRYRNRAYFDGLWYL